MNEIVNVDINGKNGSFNILSKGKKIAEMTFTFAGAQKIMIDHTEVDPALQGKGLAKKMMEKAIAVAREKNWKIVPACSFAKNFLDTNPQYEDVL